MKGYRIYLILAACFLAASGLFYYIHYLIFHDEHHIFIFLMHDIAFLPLEVFLVVIVIERILTRREKQAIMYKLNMVIGAFFSEVGNQLLAALFPHFDNKADIARNLNVQADWTEKDFTVADTYANNLKIEFDIRKIDLYELKAYLQSKRIYLLTMLENPNLLEHDRFTDLLWATTHLDEELEARTSLENIPESDLAHLSIDIERMYDNLASEWLDYVQYLKSSYPFLFSLIVRTHPFQESPSAVVK